MKFRPPPAEILDRVVQRKDDTEEACKQRLVKYHGDTAPIIPYYEGKGLLRRVDGSGAPEAITHAIAAALGA